LLSHAPSYRQTDRQTEAFAAHQSCTLRYFYEWSNRLWLLHDCVKITFDKRPSCRWGTARQQHITLEVKVNELSATGQHKMHCFQIFTFEK